MKKNRLLKLVSSICGVVAICGVFGLSLFSKKLEETSASGLTIDSSAFNGTSDYQPNRQHATGEFQTNNAYTSYIRYYGNAYLVQDVSNNVTTYNYVYEFNELTIYRVAYQYGLTMRDGSYDGSTTFRVNVMGLSNEYLNLSFRLNTIIINVVDHDHCTFNLKFDLYDIDSGNIIASPSNIYYVFELDGGFGQDYMVAQYEYNHILHEPYYDLGDDIRLIDSYFIDSTNGDFLDGFGAGYNTGFTDGYNQGVIAGNKDGYEQGYQAGLDSYQQELINAENKGYADGFADGNSKSTTAVTIFNGILNVALVPINFFLAIFDFEILGINIGSFVKALLTVTIVIFVTKLVLGNSKSGGE